MAWFPRPFEANSDAEIAIKDSLSTLQTHLLSASRDMDDLLAITKKIVPATKGGTGISSYTLGDTLYADSPATLAKLAGNTAARRYYLSQFGTGSASAAPEWRPMPLWNVMDYGAVPDAGVTDNKTAFDACVAAAYAAKSGIFIPEGIFYLSSWWLNGLSNGLVIQTAGPGTQLKFGDGATDAYGTYCMRVSGGCRKITMYGGTVNCPNDVAQDALQLGIGGAGASQAYECEFYSTVFTGNSGSTLQRGIVSEQAYIHQFYGCKILSFGIPIVFRTEANSITFYGCSARANQSKRMVLSSTGYTNAVLGDIGKTIVQAVTGATATLLSYDNTKRWWELGSITGSFSDTNAVTITSGTGAGTVVDAVYYINQKIVDAQSGQQNTFFGGDIENCGSWLSNTGCEGLSFVGVYFEASADVAMRLEDGYTHFDKCFLSEGRAYIYEGGRCSFTHNRIRKTGTSYAFYFIHYSKLTFDAAGYTNFVAGDIGLPISGGAGAAKIVAYDNATRVVTCIPTADFTNGTACATTGGSGAGTLAAAGGYTQDTPMDIPMFTAESNRMEYTVPGSTTTGLFTRGFTTGLQSWKWDASGPSSANLANFCSINQERIFDANTATLKTLMITNADGLRLNGPVDANVGDSRFKTVSLTQSIGTPPMSVVSTTKVANLNADKLDDLDSTDFARRSGFSSSPVVVSGNWYRIASNGSVAVAGTGGNRASALFTVKDATGGRNMEFSFYASINFGANPTITLVNQSTYTARLIDKIRIVYSDSVGTVEGAAVEVLVNASLAAAIKFSIYDNDATTGWVAEDFTAGSVPGGTYTSVELDISGAPIIAASVGGAANVFQLFRNGRIVGAQVPTAVIPAQRHKAHFKIASVNLNSAASDTGTFAGLPSKYRVLRLTAYDASTSLTTATFDLRTAAAGAGVALVAAFAPSALTTSAKYVDATLAAVAGTDYQTAGTLYLRNVTAQGGAATASFMLEILDMT